MESMTGYGRGSCTRYGQSLSIQVSAVNHRNCDIRLAMPREWTFLEKPMRDLIRETIVRGSVQVTAEISQDEKSTGRVKVNQALAADYFEQSEALRKKLGINQGLNLFEIMQMPEVVELKSLDASPDELTEMSTLALTDALNALQTMRTTEGKSLEQDLSERLSMVRDLVAEVEQLAPEVVVQYREKLSLRIQQILDEPALDEERLMREVAWFADKSDISEELTRLQSHLTHMAQLMAEKEPVGRRIDFLLQEMNREINTIGSKANDQTIARLVVDIKAEVERMREQAQNVQ